MSRMVGRKRAGPDHLKKIKSYFPCQKSKQESSPVLLTITSMSCRAYYLMTQLNVLYNLLQISDISVLLLEFHLHELNICGSVHHA